MIRKRSRILQFEDRLFPERLSCSADCEKPESYIKEPVNLTTAGVWGSSEERSDEEAAPSVPAGQVSSAFP